MEIEGKLFTKLEEVSGTSANGQWKKQEFVIETDGQYPKKVCFSLWGDKVDQLTAESGQKIKVSFDIESREYNGRWYTEARAWKVEGAQQSADAPADMPPPDLNNDPGISEEDDLPF